MGGRVVDDHVGSAEGDVTALDTSGGLDGGAFDVVPDVPESPAGLAGQVEPAVLPLLSIVVPAYNEALMIMGSLTTLYAYLQDLSDRYRFELIVVDDGSTDETPAIAEAFASSRPEVRVLRHPVNFRLGQALRYGISQSKGDYVVTFDSDLTYSPDHIERLVEAVREQHARICVASPYMKGGRNSGLPWNRKMMSKSVNKLLAASSQHDVSTVTGLVRAYDGPFIRGLNLKSMGPEINTEILYKAQILRARVVEIPAHLDWTGQGERMKARKVSLKVSSTSKLLMFSSFLFRPITFFLVPGLILLAISVYSLGALAWTVVQDYRDASGGNFDVRLTDAFADAWAQRPHSFIIGGLTFVVAVQLVSLGVLAAQAKRYFEDLFHIESRVLRQVAQVDERLRIVESDAATTAATTSQAGPAR